MSLDTCTAAAEGGGTSTSSSLLLYDCHKSVPAPFLTKTYHLVNDPATDYIVSWKDSDTSSFVVWRPPEFARDLLPIYFKHSNFSSFVRQLNTYVSDHVCDPLNQRRVQKLYCKLLLTISAEAPISCCFEQVSQLL